MVKQILSSIVDNAGTAAVGCVFFLLFALLMQLQLCSSIDLLLEPDIKPCMARDVLYFILAFPYP